MLYSPVMTQDNPDHNVRKSNILRRLDATSGRWTKVHYVASSRAVADMLREHIRVPEHRLTVIHNSTPVPRELPSPAVRVGVPTLVTIGRLSAEKGQRYLIDAVGVLRDAGIRVSLNIVGDGPLEPTLRAQIASRGLGDRVHLVTSTPRISRLLEDADLFVFPSLHEGFGVAVIEAMAAGVPVVASDIPAMREVLGEATPSGLLVPPRDSRALAEAITRALDQTERLRLRDRGFRRVQAEFSVERGAREYQSLYLRLTRRLPG
jgi:glycosyltransferase involved in cell wall biosynthesis